MVKLTQCLCCICLIIVVWAICVIIYLVHTYLESKKEIDKAIKKCDEYASLACRASKGNHTNTSRRKVARLIGGTDAEMGQFPHMAYLTIKSGKDKITSCGGSLISDEFILTAAQCVQDVDPSDISVKLGSLFRTNNKTGKYFNVVQIKEYAKLEKDSEGAYLNDIALLKLSKKVRFSATIRPICLATYGSVKNMDSTSVSGWGFNRAGTLSENLKQLKVIVGTGIQSECEKLWGNHFNSYDELICAGHPRADHGLCKDDLGTPLQVLYGALSEECAFVYQQIGIASISNQQCKVGNVDETFVTAYTRVGGYIPWIATNVWPD